MKLNMWNICNRLSYDSIYPMINSATSTISCARWIVSSSMKSDTVYVGSAAGFFDNAEQDALIVHRTDMVLVKNADPEELFDDVCNIIDEYMDWDRKLMACLDLREGLQKMLDVSDEVFHNPAFVYDSKGDILAISSNYKGEIHWHWQELLQNHCVTERRIKYMQKEIRLDIIFQDTQASKRSFDGDEYFHSTLYANRFAAGHLVMFNYAAPFERGIESLVDNLINWMNIYMMRHSEEFNPLRRQTQMLLDFLKQGSIDEDQERLLLETLGCQKHGFFRILVVQEQVDGEPVFLSRTYMKISETFPDILVAKQDKSLILFSVKNLCGKLPPVLAYMEEHMRENFLIGVSSEFYNFAQCPIFYQQALAELNRCRQSDVAHSIGEEHMVDYLEEIVVNNPLGLAYADSVMLRLAESDLKNGTCLYETFKTYALCFFHKNEAASMLDIHRNTLNYRIDRIKEVLGEAVMDGYINEYDEQSMQRMIMSSAFIDHYLPDLCKNAQ